MDTLRKVWLSEAEVICLELDKTLDLLDAEEACGGAKTYNEMPTCRSNIFNTFKFVEESIATKLDDLEQMIDSKDSKAIRDRVGTLSPHLLRALSIAQTSHDRSKDAIFVVKMKEHTDQLRSGWYPFLSLL